MKTLALICLTFAMAAGVSATPPPVPTTPAAVETIVYARPFVLARGYEFEWRKEKPLVVEGYIIVLKVDPDLVYPRQSLEPVLYVGNQTAERVNLGYRSGYVIAIVPGATVLVNTPIWFGTPELPERCDARSIAKERTMAQQAGVTPFPLVKITSARREGGPCLSVTDRYELRREIAALIKEYSPGESDLIRRLLVPRTGVDHLRLSGHVTKGRPDAVGEGARKRTPKPSANTASPNVATAPTANSTAATHVGATPPSPPIERGPRAGPIPRRAPWYRWALTHKAQTILQQAPGSSGVAGWVSRRT